MDAGQNPQQWQNLDSLETFILQQEQEWDDGNHVANDTGKQDGGNRQVHPNPDRNGSTKFHNWHGSNHGQDNNIGDSKRSKVIGDFLASVQVYCWSSSGGDGHLFGSHGSGCIHHGQSAKDHGGSRKNLWYTAEGNEPISMRWMLVTIAHMSPTW